MRGTGIDEYLERYGTDIKKYYNYDGYIKLKGFLSDKYSDKQKYELLTQYCFLLKQFENHNNDIVMSYVTENYPEIVSFWDLIDTNNAYFKFIWSFYKKDEELIDNIFAKRSFPYTKYYVNFQDNNIIIYVINLEIKCDYNDDIFHSEDARKIQELGYKPFDQFKRKMISHGMSWYIYGNPITNFSEMCRLFPVRMLSVGDKNTEDKDWSKIGYRADLDCGFRSAWEANVARILNKKVIPWEYEKKFFSLQPPKYYKESNNAITYIPDFILEDGTIIEVKGFWDNRSKMLISQFMEQYPDKKIIVVDTDLYRCISNKYKNIILNWEDEKISFTNDFIQVIGITLPQRKTYVSQVKVGDILEIVREPFNEYDSRAIRVNNSNGNQIGYFAKDCNCIYSPKMDMGFKYEIRVVSKDTKVLQCKIKLINTEEMIIPDIFK